MFSSLMPQRKEFFELLAAHSDRVVAGANATLRLINGLGKGTEDIPVLVAEVNMNEQSGDKIKAELITLLHRSFTTPINRDQIHTLTIELDNVLNALQDVARDVKVMASLHYVHNRYRLYDEKFVGTDFTLPYHFLNPRLGVNYNLDERWNAYMSVGFTSREPRLKNLYDAAESSTPASWGAVVPQFAADASGRLDFERPLVKPESLLNLELGCGYTSDVLRFSGNVDIREVNLGFRVPGRLAEAGLETRRAGFHSIHFRLNRQTQRRTACARRVGRHASVLPGHNATRRRRSVLVHR